MRALLILLALAIPAVANDTQDLIAASRAQVDVTTTHDPSYTALASSGGDVDRTRGVCTDVVIRALRDAWGIDLQLAINRDMTAHLTAYPQLWGLQSTNRNIDHRRVPHLQTLLSRIGAEGATSTHPASFHAGDIVTYTLPGNLPHIAIVCDRMGARGPMILHNIGRGAQEEDSLFAYPITRHDRLTPKALGKLRVP